MTQIRMYNAKDVEMLMASKTIVNSLQVNLSDLSMVRSNWTEDYVSNLNDKIDHAVDTYLGLDKKKELREATAALAAIQAPALRDLAFMKTQIEVDFGKEAKEINKNLGYEKYLSKARNGDQEAMIQLLFAFKKGMKDRLKTDIVAKGTNPALIDRIVACAGQLSNANIVQESLKSSGKTVSETALKTFNEIYTEIIGICKIASAYYQSDDVLKAQFAFSRVVANMNVTRKVTEPEEVE